MLSINDISKQFKGQKSWALNQISFEIQSNEIYGFLGPNGAGKTTLFSIISGIYPPTSGTVSFNGENLFQNFRRLKYKIGVVPQEIALYPTLSAVQNLKFIGRMYGIAEKELDQKIHSFLDYFEFDENRNSSVKSYSGGMKRKINLIAGLLHDPELLLLDEPTAGMDVQSRNKMMEELKRINNDHELSILYTSHYLEQAQKFCDRITIVSKGELKASGTPEEIIKANNQTDLESVFIQLTQ